MIRWVVLAMLVAAACGSGGGEPDESVAIEASGVGEGDRAGDSIVVASPSDWPTVLTGEMPDTGEAWSVSVADPPPGEHCVNVTLSSGGIPDCATPPQWSDHEVAVPLTFVLASNLENMLVVGLVPAQAEDFRLNDASASYELEVNSSAQVFALVGPRDLQARSLTIARGQESVECSVVGPVRDLVYRC